MQAGGVAYAARGGARERRFSFSAREVAAAHILCYTIYAFRAIQIKRNAKNAECAPPCAQRDHEPIGKLFLRGEDRADLIGARTRAGVFSGVLGIACNLLLAGAKIALGAVSGMISVLADGINNLTDCGSNTVSLIGFRVSGKPADSEHPFGHRRAEPVAALIVAVLILVVAAELAVQSVQSIFSPQEGGFSLALVLVLAAAIAVKLFLFGFNLALAHAFGSDALKATATDSLTGLRRNGGGARLPVRLPLYGRGAGRVRGRARGGVHRLCGRVGAERDGLETARRRARQGDRAPHRGLRARLRRRARGCTI